MTLITGLSSLITDLGTDFKRGTIPVSFAAQGTMTVRTGKSRVQLLGSGIIVAVYGYLDTAPTGATTFKVDVNKNGTTIYGTQGNRPIWTASANAATVGSHSVTTYSSGDTLSCDVDAVGSTVPGSDLSITVWLLRTGD